MMQRSKWSQHPMERVPFLLPLPSKLCQKNSREPQIAIGVQRVGSSALWIRSFLNSRRTPAGLARLTDDDYFRMIFAAVGGILGAIFFLILWPGLSSWMINSLSDLFNVLSNKLICFPKLAKNNFDMRNPI